MSDRRADNKKETCDFLLKKQRAHSWTSDMTRKFHSTYQVLRGDTSGCNQAQMDCHSRLLHVHHSGMPPSVSHVELLQELTFSSQLSLLCLKLGSCLSLQFLLKAAVSLCKKDGSGH